MKMFFSPDSWMYRLLGHFVDLFLLNVLFLVTSLPVVTIGVSLTALFSVTNKMVNDENSSVISLYFREFKNNFKRGLGLSAVLLVGLTLLFISFNYLSLLKGISFGFGIFSMTFLGLVILVHCLYIYPYTAKYEDKMWNSLKATFQIALLNIKQTLFLILCIVGFFLIGTFGNFGFAFITLVTLFIGFSLFASLISYITLPIFQKYERV